MSNPFPPTGTRQWTRITNAARAISAVVLGKGELAVTETGKVVAGNGTTPLSGLSPFLTAAEALAQYVTWDGTNLRINGVIIPISCGAAVTTVDNGDGTYTSTGSGAVNNGDGTYTLTDSSVTDNGDGTYSLAA